jgi:asparagine N-glycosylation enzyme membrane subunit Stt3
MSNNTKSNRNNALRYVPFTIIVIAAYLLMGFLIPDNKGWHPGWLIFFLIPLWDSVLSAIERRNLASFEFPVFVVGLYLFFGFVMGIWHPTWIVFLAIPAYYSSVHSIRAAMNSRKYKDNGGNEGGNENGR